MFGTNISRFPLIRQYDKIDCGPVCLLSILKYYNGNTSLVHMRELCNTGANGSSMSDLIDAAKQVGFEAYGAEGEYNDLMKETMPCIAHVITGEKLAHFFVIYKIDHERVYIADPAKGRYCLSREEFIKIWKSKSVVLLAPSDKVMKLDSPVWYKWVLEYIKKEDTWVYQSIFLGIIYTIISLLTSLFVQIIIDKYIPDKNISKVIFSGSFLIILLAVKVTAGFFRQRFLVELNNRISVCINADFITHIFKLPRKFFDSRKTGDITARINDALKIHQSILQITSSTVIDLLVIGFAFIFLFRFSFYLAVLTLCAVPIYLAMMIYGSVKIKAHQREVMKNHSLVEASYIDSLGGIDEIISFSAAGHFSGINRSLFRNYQEKIKALGLTQSNLTYATEGFGVLVTITLLVLGAALVINKQIMLGQMMASFSLFGTIMPSIGSLVGSIVGLQGASIAAQRMMDLFLVQAEKTEGKEITSDWNCLELKHAGFGWDKRSYLFRNARIKIPKGKICALYGASGSGKSTIVQILLRKYELKEGSLLLDSTDVTTFDLLAYRRSIGLVPQNIKIFNGSIMDNILIGRDLTSGEELDKKIRQLGFESFFRRFEHGCYTMLGEDSRHLSGGEKQVIALVRAMFDLPKVLIIDEGLSGLDQDLADMIFDRLRQYAENNCVLIVTHNHKTLEKCDFSYKIENGQISLCNKLLTEIL